MHLSCLGWRRAVRWPALVAATAGLAACGGSSTTPSAVPTSPPTTVITTTTEVVTTTAAPVSSTTVATIPAATTTTTTSTVPAGPQPCSTAHLVVSLGPPNGAAGSTYESLSLANDGTASCTLSGFPGVSAVAGGSGTQVGAPAARDSSSPVASVTLAPGASATATLRVIDPLTFDPAACQLTPVLGLRVYPPGQTTSAFVAQQGQGCASVAVTTMFIGAIQAA